MEVDKVDVKPPIEVTKPVPKIDKAERLKCQVCSGPERCNVQKKPEIFVSCTNCTRNGKLLILIRAQTDEFYNEA